MATDLNEPFADRRIRTDDDCYDVIYWSIKFGVSVERLVDAVAEVGPLVKNVERHLKLSAAVMADPSPPSADRYVPQFHGQGAAGLADGWIVQPDPTAFLVRNDKPYLFQGRCGVESLENDPVACHQGARNVEKKVAHVIPSKISVALTNCHR